MGSIVLHAWAETGTGSPPAAVIAIPALSCPPRAYWPSARTLAWQVVRAPRLSTSPYLETTGVRVPAPST
jgi:hypothetical protein